MGSWRCRVPASHPFVELVLIQEYHAIWIAARRRDKGRLSRNILQCWNRCGIHDEQQWLQSVLFIGPLFYELAFKKAFTHTLGKMMVGAGQIGARKGSYHIIGVYIHAIHLSQIPQISADIFYPEYEINQSAGVWLAHNDGCMDSLR